MNSIAAAADVCHVPYECIDLLVFRARRLADMAGVPTTISLVLMCYCAYAYAQKQPPEPGCPQSVAMMASAGCRSGSIVSAGNCMVCVMSHFRGCTWTVSDDSSRLDTFCSSSPPPPPAPHNQPSSGGGGGAAEICGGQYVTVQNTASLQLLSTANHNRGHRCGQAPDAGPPPPDRPSWAAAPTGALGQNRATTQWYRLPTGVQLATVHPGNGRCGTVGTGWLTP